MWTDETKVDLCENDMMHYVRREMGTAYQHKRGSTVEGASRFGATLLLPGLEQLAIVEEKMIPKFIKVSYRIFFREAVRQLELSRS